MIALIQKRAGEIATTNGHCAFIGFRERGHEVRFFEAAAFDDIELTGEMLVVGGVPIIQKALSKLGIPFPSLPSLPPPLGEYAKRRIWEATLKDVRELVDSGKAVFIKPAANKLKQFPGHVIRNYADLAVTAGIDGGTSVVCADVLEMTSEYRVYVTNGAVVGCKHYWGDFRKFPDFSFIDSTVAAFDQAPRGFAIDFAVLSNGETALIEVNDGFALGSYGLQPMLYAALLEARWRELADSI
ncbi:ATP-grasp domain-containing protein [Pseudoduganella violaceinigra]|uniref:ATP-grasp domain-containing protein n=1 Tax=Pseudoduganella violaceinigra TaxID=246602 RepID=UPI00040223B2|nr:ATP-grasp domain-containing protein [Pseudoduganella violaceinigra]